MAFAATTVWEVRNTASDTNGGGFNSAAAGTDYTQQDSHQHQFTDMVIDGAVNTRFTSAARPGVAADVGNTINVSAGVGFTVQTVQIVSLTGSAYNVDKSLGTLGSTGGTGKLGGAKASPASAFALGAASNTYYIKEHSTSSYSISGPTGPAGGTTAAPTRIIGYRTSRSAADNPAPGGELASLLAGTSGSPVIQISSGTLVKNISIDAGGLANYCSIILGNSRLMNCRASSYLQRGFVFQGSSHQSADDCVASSGSGGSGTAGDLRAAFCNTGGVLHCTRCVVNGGATNGFGTQNSIIVLNNCVAVNLTQASSAGGHGVQVFGDGDIIAHHCTFANLGGSGVYTNGGSSCENSMCHNSIFANIDRYAFEGDTGATALTTGSFADRYRYNAFYDVTLGSQGGAVTVFGTGRNEITLTASPFLSSVDFGLNTTAGGGALLRQAGIPGLFPLLDTTTGYPDIGAVQASVASSSGSSASQMRTWWREWTNEEDATRIPDSIVDIYIGRGMEALNRIVQFSWTDDTSTTLVAGTQEYSIPTDCVIIAWVEHNGVRLKKADIEELHREGVQWRTAPAGTPSEWAIYGNKLVMLPAPNAAAVAADSTLTIRYVRAPRDFTTYGPEQLNTQDLAIPVYHAVSTWSIAHPDNAAAQSRVTGFKALFEESAKGIAMDYEARRLEK